MDTYTLNTYLFFPRNCRDAMQFYQSVIGGELTMQTRGEVDPAAPDDMKELIIHAALSGGIVNLMGSDNTDVTIKPQNRIAISVSGKNSERLHRLYNDLAAGGTADYPLKKEFWGDTFGGLTDKYGISWLINIEAAHD